MAPGLALMVAKRGPEPKKKGRDCKKTRALQIFWPRFPQFLKPPLFTWKNSFAVLKQFLT